MKKAQTEIMGLLVIIILLSFIMLFALKFIILKQPAEYKKEFTQTELASNILSTLFRTTSQECGGLSFAQLYQDCTENWNTGSIICNKGTLNETNSCNYTAEKTKTILDETLKKWNIGYEFYAYTNQRKIIEIKYKNKACAIGKTQGNYPIQVGAGATTLYTILNICG